MTASDYIRRHRVLRQLLPPARRLRSFARRTTAPESRARRAFDRSKLLVAALPSRIAMRQRRAAIATAIARLPAPTVESRLVSIVCTRDDEGRTIPPAQGVETEIVTAPERASGSLICFLGPSAEPLEAGWLARLTEAVRGGVVASAPLLLHPRRGLPESTAVDLQVAALGYDIALPDDASPTLRARHAGSQIGARGAPEVVHAAMATCLVVDRERYEAVGGWDRRLEPDGALVDLCARLRARDGTIVAVPAAVVTDHRRVRAAADVLDPFATRRDAWDAVIARRGPELFGTVRPHERPRIAISTAVPSRKVAPRWGDWHFAMDLARALRRLGYDVRVQTAAEADSVASRSCDVHMVLRGLRPIVATPGQRQILWIISHPETVTADECDAADLVFVASERYARELRSRTHTPIETLWQATDHRRFRPQPRDPRYEHSLAVVAKTRTVMRPIVADALAAGLRPAIYGSGWEQFVDADLVVAQHIPNDELPLVYASTDVLLNDHWEAMRTRGFVSNRIFDALACGTPVVSDAMPEISDLFGDGVACYETPDDLGAVVRAAQADLVRARERAAAGRARVLAAHTFDHRAEAIAAAIERHRLFTFGQG